MSRPAGDLLVNRSAKNSMLRNQNQRTDPLARSCWIRMDAYCGELRFRSESSHGVSKKTSGYRSYKLL